MNKISIAALIAAVSLSFAPITFAQDQAEEQQGEAGQTDAGKPRGHHSKKMHKRHKMMLKRVDTNEDGKIDLNEYLANAEARFNKLDLDGDGYVTPEEHKAAGKAMREKYREMRMQKRAERKAKRAEQQDAESEE